MSARIIINSLILLVLATFLGIILYIIFNFKNLLEKVLNTGLLVVKQNNSKIQGTLDNFSTTTVDNLLSDNKLQSTVGNYVATMVNKLINEKKFDASATAMINRVLSDPTTSHEIDSIIANSGSATGRALATGIGSVEGSLGLNGAGSAAGSSKQSGSSAGASSPTPAPAQTSVEKDASAIISNLF